MQIGLDWCMHTCRFTFASRRHHSLFSYPRFPLC
jgi:hypothetical protein